MPRGYTPKVRPTKSCNACSLKELCLPKLLRSSSVSAYLRGAMEDDAMRQLLNTLFVTSEDVYLSLGR